MHAIFAPVAALLLTTAVLLVGQGLQGLLVPVDAALHGFTARGIGLMGSCYFAGFVAGSLFGPRLIGRVGHIRSFSILAAVAAAMPLLCALFVNPWTWAAFRGVTGFCFAGLFMTIESWLNERADNATRGRILSTYTAINLFAIMGGQLLLQLPDASGFARFALASVLISLATVPVALTKTLQPQPISTPRVDLLRLYRVSPVAVVSAVFIGLASACFWTLGPVFAAGTGYGDRFVAFFMSAAVFGGALAQWPLGRWSDKMDRRKMIVYVAGGAAISGALLAVAGAVKAPEPVFVALAFCQGAGALSVWAIVLAHANDAAEPGDFVHLSSGFLLIYGLGAVAGPFLGSLLTAEVGFAGVFMATALFHGTLALFTIYRMGLRHIMPRGRFVAVPRTSTSVFQLDPRAEGDDGARPDPGPLPGAPTRDAA